MVGLFFDFVKSAIRNVVCRNPHLPIAARRESRIISPQLSAGDSYHIDIQPADRATICCKSGFTA